MRCLNDFCKDGILEVHSTDFHETLYCTSCGFYDQVEFDEIRKKTNYITGYEKRHIKINAKKRKPK